MTQNKQMVYLNHMACINALGADHQSVFSKLIQADTSGMQSYLSPATGRTFLVGQVALELPTIPEPYLKHNTRNNRLVHHCLQQLSTQLKEMLEQYPNHRIGVIIGTSTSGIAEGEQALQKYSLSGHFPDDFDYSQIEMSSPADFIKDYLQLQGPAYCISTACSSSGKVFASARSLIENDLCDAVIVGGSDSLCDMTLNGFDSLEAISSDLCLPFSANRKGINIGEGAALFIMSREKSEVALLGVGESSDAHHISAPHPEGAGAVSSMQMALSDAGISSDDVDYLNLHGTGTELNDLMEGKAVHQVLPTTTMVSSTKPLTGHTLGAAGATELAFCWLALNQQGPKYSLPKHAYDGHYDQQIPPLTLASSEHHCSDLSIAMSNSFAFGGNNVSVIIGRS
ncbi:beta-ketoacyl-[acyl-carrier-protein] synthase family protein [Kangiella aquimarina]|uniref:Beta-ketoacyl-[acyl-carrier-protein] synthase family protein n=1 Tax=Kangiella aquimarina TaxID=261965 RepID=A0ABZ0X575_9GAMM|nr:beta-ketoacyl-[acyl-carrier-protein] synthase family protein [Kangiella aquimarina]WQG85684.1 beta-ketoacyl-[acyl-carrier-protein] synthase family protein [Kangiella aquimarina]